MGAPGGDPRQRIEPAEAAGTTYSDEIITYAVSITCMSEESMAEPAYRSGA